MYRWHPGVTQYASMPHWGNIYIYMYMYIYIHIYIYIYVCIFNASAHDLVCLRMPHSTSYVEIEKSQVSFAKEPSKRYYILQKRPMISTYDILWGLYVEIIGLFCRIQYLLEGSCAKKSYHFKEPTNHSRPTVCNTVRRARGIFRQHPHVTQ